MSFTHKIVAHNSPEYWQEVDLRYRVLRQPLGLEFSQQELNKEADQLHITAWQDGKLAGCAVLVIVDENTLKMRQVAVEPELQRKGIGQSMVSYAEYYAIDNGYCRIELHAREEAVQFYLDLGYSVLGSRFMEVTIPHFKMVKDWCSVIGH